MSCCSHGDGSTVYYRLVYPQITQACDIVSDGLRAARGVIHVYPPVDITKEFQRVQQAKHRFAPTVEFRPYLILGACNPPLAHRPLSAELGIGLLLPRNLVVYDNLDGTSTVEAMDPQAALGLVGDNTAVVEVASEARKRLGLAIDALSVK